MTIREFPGGAGVQTLTASMNSGTLSVTISGSTGWTSGAGGPFAVVIDPGLANEEKCLVTSRSSNTLTFGTRGYDGTTAQSHQPNAFIRPCFTATDLAEANAHVNASSGVHGITGAVVGTLDAQTLSNKSLTAPVIGDYSNAVHDHTNPANGGTLLSAVTLSGTQTLSNKTLISPVLTTPVIGDYSTATHTHRSAVQGGTILNTFPSVSYVNSFADNGGGTNALTCWVDVNGWVRVTGTAKRTTSWASNTPVVTGAPAPTDGAQWVCVGWNITAGVPIRWNITSGGSINIIYAGAANDVVSLNGICYPS